MDVTQALLESWDRQCRILNAVASKVDESNRKALPSPDGWPLDKHLAHVHLVRSEWLRTISPRHAEGLPSAFTDGWRTPIDDLEAIKDALRKSAAAIATAMRDLLAENAGPAGGYDHPVFFLQHMVWHEGWHVGLLFLGLRLAGQEPAEEWEEAHVWGEWRVE